jgi:hypothetical protein
MKQLVLFSVISIALLLSACDKYSMLPPYTPAFSSNFSVTALNHTEDSVNVGDSIYLTATGTIADTTQSIYAYFASSYTASGVNSVYNFGSASAPIKLTRTIGALNAAGVPTWTSTILLPGATFVPDKTKLTITGNFIYQLSLSSESGTSSAADAGIKNKTIYVR